MLENKKEFYKKHWYKYFLKKYNEFINFLETAIKLNSDIECSI